MNFYCLTILFLAIVNFVIGYSKIIPFIRDGEQATNDSFPSIVSIQITVSNSTRHVCTGTILSKKLVLTSATCTNPQPNIVIACDKSNLLNDPEASPNRQVRNILRTVRHPNYYFLDETNSSHTPEIRLYDFAILEMEEPFIFTKDCHSLNITRATLPDRTQCKIAGWGETGAGLKMPVYPPEYTESNKKMYYQKDDTFLQLSNFQLLKDQKNPDITNDTTLPPSTTTTQSTSFETTTKSSTERTTSETTTKPTMITESTTFETITKSITEGASSETTTKPTTTTESATFEATTEPITSNGGDFPDVSNETTLSPNATITEATTYEATSKGTAYPSFTEIPDLPYPWNNTPNIITVNIQKWLTWGNTNIVPHDKCREKIQYDKWRMVCVEWSNETSAACLFDGGTPLICDDKIQGIASVGISDDVCQYTYFAYAKVPIVFKWINYYREADTIDKPFLQPFTWCIGVIPTIIIAIFLLSMIVFFLYRKNYLE